MGICSSKKKLPLSPSPVEKPATTNPPPQSVEPEKKAKKQPVFVIAPKQPKAATPVSSEDGAAKNKADDNDSDCVIVNAPKAEEAARAAAVRTSSCSKEEVDAILIQCGRLSRSASGKASGDRKYSGSKRSYDFDNESEETEKAVPRPSPRRRTPNRERSGSRERGGGSRRVSRSPGRRSDGPEKPKPIQPQPGKLVPVPAREKGEAKRAPAAAVGPSRSNSPAKRGSGENAGLSRSNSRKAEQSPYRRNPMVEIDDNSQRTSQAATRAHKSREGEEAVRKSSPVRTQSSQRTGEKKSGMAADASKGSRTSSTTSNRVREQLMSCRAKENSADSEIAEEDKEAKPASARARSSSSRRSSRDFDNPTAPNPTSYASLLLSDIQNYHQQNVAAGFSLPACVSKARSILEAVADLNSSSSDQSNHVVDGNVQSGRGSYISEIVVRDDLMEPSLHKYISVRDAEPQESAEPSLHKYISVRDAEPQESAGSNSFAGQPWGPSREPDSVDSTDRHWASSRCNDGDGEVDFDADRRQLHRGGSGVSGGVNVNVVRSGGRACSLPAAM